MLQFIEKETDSEFDPSQINKIINKFQQTITLATDKAFGVSRQQKIRKRSVLWQNGECKIAMQESHHAFNRTKKHPTNENLTKFKKKRGEQLKKIKSNHEEMMYHR